jgi:hypothetical protein
MKLESEVPTAFSIKTMVSSDIKLCSLVDGYVSKEFVTHVFRTEEA